MPQGVAPLRCRLSPEAEGERGLIYIVGQVQALLDLRPALRRVRPVSGHPPMDLIVAVDPSGLRAGTP